MGTSVPTSAIYFLKEPPKMPEKDAILNEVANETVREKKGKIHDCLFFVALKSTQIWLAASLNSIKKANSVYK